MKQKLVEYRRWRAKAIKDPAVKRALDAGDDDPAIFIALQLIELRTRQGLTQTELARRLGTSQQAIARFESLGYSGFTVKALKRIAEVFHKKLKVQFV